LPVQKRIIDNGARSPITNSKLQHYIDDQGLGGVLSNFQRLQATIEEKKYAIDFSTLANQNIKCSARYKYDYLIRRDLQLAADLLKQPILRLAVEMVMFNLISLLTRYCMAKVRSLKLKSFGIRSAGVI
jgi:hypothetical protein